MSSQSSTAAAVSDAARSSCVLRAESLRKSFPSGSTRLSVLNGIRFQVSAGELIAVVGPSGSGKSTLLHLLAALDTPSSGAIYFDGKALDALSETERADYRNRSVGFVWQRHHLLPDFTAAENVAMPLLLRDGARHPAEEAARGWLAEVGLAERARQKVAELSGGEQQRVAIARALVGGPRLLLADEPTGDLDEQNAELVYQLIERLHRDHHLSSVLATHNLSLARRCHRVLALEHGILEPAPASAGLEREPQGKRNHV